MMVHLRAMSNASFMGTFVYKLFTSGDIKISLGSMILLFKFSLASSKLVSMFALSVFFNSARILIRL